MYLGWHPWLPGEFGGVRERPCSFHHRPCPMKAHDKPRRTLFSLTRLYLRATEFNVEVNK